MWVIYKNDSVSGKLYLGYSQWDNRTWSRFSPDLIKIKSSDDLAEVIHFKTEERCKENLQFIPGGIVEEVSRYVIVEKNPFVGEPRYYSGFGKDWVSWNERWHQPRYFLNKEDAQKFQKGIFFHETNIIKK